MTKLKLFIFAISLMNIPQLTASVKKISGNEEAFKDLEKSAIEFAKTNSSPKTGPSIKDLIKPNRKFFAKIECFGLNRYFTFESDEGANQIQLVIYNGGGIEAKWYYLDANIVANTSNDGKKEKSETT